MPVAEKAAALPDSYEPPISEIDPLEEAGGTLQSFIELLDVDAEKSLDDHADIVASETEFQKVVTDPAEEEQDYCIPCASELSVEHLSLHLPKIQGCVGCDWGKHARKPKRRRTEVCFAVAGADAVGNPFGALVHADWMEMRHGSAAYRVAQRALMLTDDQTVFVGGFSQILRPRR